ncbi:MAG: RluA family pseudouridine synthase [Chthoniobacteraceae bacterium]
MPKPSTVSEPAELLAYLFAIWPDMKKKQIRDWLKFKAVTVNAEPITQFNHRLKPGDVVAIRENRFALDEKVLPFRIRVVFEDASLIIIEKPAGLLSMSSASERERTAYFQLTDYVRQGDPQRRERVWIVHRLDRETSGLMIFAKSEDAKRALQTGWDQVEKRYEAIVEGGPKEDEGVFESDLDETNVLFTRSGPRTENTRHAITRFRVLKRARRFSRVQLNLVTGRRHQIRVHLADAGCPIIGDEKYGATTDLAKRLGLHSCAMVFKHPVTGQEMTFESPLPGVLSSLV